MSSSIIPRIGVTFGITFILYFFIWYVLWWRLGFLNFITTLVFSGLAIRIGRSIAFQLIWETKFSYVRSSRGAVLVTGASRGLGKAAVEELLSAGYVVFAGVRRLADGEALKTSIPNMAATTVSKLYSIELDVSKEESVQAAVTQVKETLDELNLPLISLINNAGVAVMGPIEAVPSNEVQNIMDVNVIGMFRTIRLFLPLLREAAALPASHVRIVNVSSPAGIRCHPFMGPYCSSKYAVEGLSDSLRKEVSSLNIDVVIVEPSLIESDMLKDAISAEETVQQVFSKAPTEVTSVYEAAGLKFAKSFSAAAKEFKSPPSLFGKYIVHALSVGDADLSTRYIFGRAIFWLPTLISLAPDRVMDWYWLIIPLIVGTEKLLTIAETAWLQFIALLKEKAAPAGIKQSSSTTTQSATIKKKK